MNRWTLKKMGELALKMADSTKRVWRKTWGGSSDVTSKFEDRKLK